MFTLEFFFEKIRDYRDKGHLWYQFFLFRERKLFFNFGRRHFVLHKITTITCQKNLRKYFWFKRSRLLKYRKSTF